MNYSPKLLDHYHHPRNVGTIKKPTHKSEESNPACGDEITVFLNIANGKIKDIKYEARGCSLVVAGASVVGERIMNHELGIREIQKIRKADIEKLLGVKVSASREQCMMLAVNTIKKALE